jgi:hypothetical protein
MDEGYDYHGNDDDDIGKDVAVSQDDFENA